MFIVEHPIIIAIIVAIILTLIIMENTEIKPDIIINLDLKSDLEKIKTYDDLHIMKSMYMEDLQKVFTIEINDNSYLYTNEPERNKDYLTITAIL